MRTWVIVVFIFLALSCVKEAIAAPIDYTTFKIPDLFGVTFTKIAIPKLKDLALVLLDGVQVAGLITRKVKKTLSSSPFEVNTKMDEDLTSATIADFAVQIYMKCMLCQTFPSLDPTKLVGEESVDDDSDIVKRAIQLLKDLAKDKALALTPGYLVWRNNLFAGMNLPDKALELSKLFCLIDPIDATGEFVRTDPQNYQAATTLAGCALDGKPYIGVAHESFAYVNNNKYEGRTYCGIPGHLFDVYPPVEELSRIVNPGTQLANQTKRVRGRIAVTQLMQGVPEIFGAMQGLDLSGELAENNLYRMGGAGKKGIDLVRKKDLVIALFPHGYTNLWDILAIHAILKSTGGDLCDLNGKSIIYDIRPSYLNKDGVLMVKHEATRDDWIKFLNPIWVDGNTLIKAFETWLTSKAAVSYNEFNLEMILSAQNGIVGKQGGGECDNVIVGLRRFIYDKDASQLLFQSTQEVATYTSEGKKVVAAFLKDLGRLERANSGMQSSDQPYLQFLAVLDASNEAVRQASLKVTRALEEQSDARNALILIRKNPANPVELKTLIQNATKKEAEFEVANNELKTRVAEMVGAAVTLRNAKESMEEMKVKAVKAQAAKDKASLTVETTLKSTPPNTCFVKPLGRQEIEDEAAALVTLVKLSLEKAIDDEKLAKEAYDNAQTNADKQANNLC